MLALKCLMGLVMASIAMAQSWDIAMMHKRNSKLTLELFNNNRTIQNAQFHLRDSASALTYDDVHKILFFAGTPKGDNSIFAYNIVTKDYKTIVMRKPTDGIIKDIAFDPVKGMLFWTDGKSLNVMSVHQGAVTGHVDSIKLGAGYPQAIVVDSCRGYIYWIHQSTTNYKIERSRYDGSDMKVLVNIQNHNGISLAIDQHTKKLYWVDKQHKSRFHNVYVAELDGTGQSALLYKNAGHEFNKLVVSEGFVYLEDDDCNIVWRMPKFPAARQASLTEFISHSGRMLSIAASYVEDPSRGVPECKDFYKLLNLCETGVKELGGENCKCPAGFMGAICDVSVCHNYCITGNCTLDYYGRPQCSCEQGYSGDRCEESPCKNYCVNNGSCTLSEQNSPICECDQQHDGSRCEILKITEKLVSVDTENVSIPKDVSNNGSDHAWSHQVINTDDLKGIIISSKNQTGRKLPLRRGFRVLLKL